MGSCVFCRGPTSRFLISGANLMIPGVVGVEGESSVIEGGMALIFSLGTQCPYAIGVFSKNAEENSESGVGVIVTHCYKDELWQDTVSAFAASCGALSSSTQTVPSYFKEDSVEEDLSGFTADQDETQAPEAAGDVEKHAEEENQSTEWNDLFKEEDNILNFCLCSTVRTISASQLPMPLTKFTSLVSLSYPRGVSCQPVSFEKTKHKKALAFFESIPDFLKITEQQKGVHVLESVNKSSIFFRENKTIFEEYYTKVFLPALDEESLKLEAERLKDTKLVFHQKIVSYSIIFKPKKQLLSEELIRVLLLGKHSTAAENKFPSFEEVATAKTEKVPEENDAAEIREALNEVYLKKDIHANLMSYIKSNSLLKPGEDGGLPTILLHGALGDLPSKGCSEAPLNKVVDYTLHCFQQMYELVLQTSVVGAEATGGSIPPRTIIKTGVIPSVHVWAERSHSKKEVTIVKNLEALGFNIDLFAHTWKKKFSVSCSVTDPSKDMHNLKPGKKVPLEIHVQGNKVNLVLDALKEAGVPSDAIVQGK
ncbi:translation initiation factor 2D [Angomonas deanei]|uniref:Translation initiation factor SUI1, putative n=1 Tax=Angomonas deanei TaxID=59799 RepID=A0A7G2CJF2_9TRYP|nr:translation initiation factor 2D [Angomonas deanei]CAD2218392.1 Translation initiation factor SUI1, putative [Angomonas deanei]|eukprot:EPY22135.1 translation initiation factor 2D [Angomonas deanei]